ncbi:WD repeat-containing protein 75 [Achroia grisella]|uniref:WD repeat-containing protein 75 n=1 Tax=Achroia grisella TaxID=688607 RepID=UPI0027D200B0|nr:WD repeat-containing protein 75 [Achroia grisella]
MGIKKYESIDENNYIFSRKGGRSIIERRPLFSPDGQSVAVIVENIVRVYNIQTGDCVRSLETETSINELVAIQFPENQDYNLYGCSDRGCVTTWTWEQGAVLREINLKLKHDFIVTSFNMLNNTDCFITGCRSNKILSLCVYSVKTGDLLQTYDNMKIQNNPMLRVSIGYCNEQIFAAIINGTTDLYIQNLYQPHIYNVMKSINVFRITAVAAHHRENAIAIGDAIGRVVIFRGYLFNKKSIGQEVLHWHYLPPLDLCFSLQGSYLYSGGIERVLVKWTAGNLTMKVNEKNFIPRLPGNVRFIVVNNSHIAITLSNNSMVIASADMRVVCTILECGGLSSAAQAIGTSLVYHRNFRALLMGGRSGCLQLYSPQSDKVLYNIDITNVNRMIPSRRNILPIEIEVTCVAISSNGQWLVTSEYRNDGRLYPEEKLKFWEYHKKKTTPYQLNTCANLSHGGCMIVSLSLNDEGDLCVSAGTDQKFRIWRRETVEDQKKNARISWSCVTACYYSSGVSQFLSHDVLNKYKLGEPYIKDQVDEFPHLRVVKKDDIIKKVFNIHKEKLVEDPESVIPGMKVSGEHSIGGVDISHDGSLIAAWFGCKLTLWDTYLCTLRTSLSHFALRPKGVHVRFGNKDAAHYLVCTTNKCLAVWSLLSLTVKWLVQIQPTCLAADPFTNIMAVTTINNDIYVFNPHNSTPILTQKKLLDPKTGVFKLCTFGQSSSKAIRLYVMRNDSEIYSIEPKDKQSGNLEAVSQRNLPVSNFSSLLAQQSLSGVRSAPTNHDTKYIDNSQANSTVAQLITASPHMVPPVSLLSVAFLQDISGQREIEETSHEQEEEMVIDPVSSDDEDDMPKLNVPAVTQLWTPNYEEVKTKKINKIINEPFLDLHTTSSIFNL